MYFVWVLAQEQGREETSQHKAGQELHMDIQELSFLKKMEAATFENKLHYKLEAKLQKAKEQ